MTNLYSYQLQEQHANTLSAPLPCDDTVQVLPSDQVCYALVAYIINGNLYPPQRIMNVPFQDNVRMPLYFQYFVNNQALQLIGQQQPQDGQTGSGSS